MRHLIIFFCLLSILDLFLSIPSYAQLQFKVFDTESGLSNNLTTRIVQDRTGYLWVGTLYGLNRFDGYSFKAFRHNSNDDNSIADNRISALAVDKLNRIWIGGALGITCYEPEKNLFTHYKLLGDTSRLGITFIEVEHENLIWIGFGGYGLVELNPETKSVRRIDLSPYINKSYNPRDFLSYNSVNGMYRDKEGIYWLATSDGLYQYNRTTRKLKPIRVVEDGIKSKHRDDFFLRIVSDNTGGFWLSSNSGGISHYNPGNHSFKTYKYEEQVGTANSVGDIAWKSEDQFWIATADKGLGIFNIRTKSFTFFESSDIFGKKSDPVWSLSDLFLDRANILWGSSSYGLVMVNAAKSTFVFKPIFRNYSPSFEILDAIADSRVKKKFFATAFGPGLLVSNEDETNLRSFECRKNPFYENYNIVQDLLNEDGNFLWVVS